MILKVKNISAHHVYGLTGDKTLAAGASIELDSAFVAATLELAGFRGVPPTGTVTVGGTLLVWDPRDARASAEAEATPAGASMRDPAGLPPAIPKGFRAVQFGDGTSALVPDVASARMPRRSGWQEVG